MPYADIIYTPQCWAEVELARQKFDPDLDEMRSHSGISKIKVWTGGVY